MSYRFDAENLSNKVRSSPVTLPELYRLGLITYETWYRLPLHVRENLMAEDEVVGGSNCSSGSNDDDDDDIYSSEGDDAGERQRGLVQPLRGRRRGRPIFTV